MDNFTGLFIEDEEANAQVYTRFLEAQGLSVVCLRQLPSKLEEYYEIILENNIDFLIIDYHLEKQVPYKGIDVLREVRKHDSTIYAVLLTNYKLNDFSDQFGDYDYELNKADMVARHKDVVDKIKRACKLRKENIIRDNIATQLVLEEKSIDILKEIKNKLDTMQ